MKKHKKRPRGGASYPCPTCGSHSHVIVTKRDASGSVIRSRQCLVKQCGTRFLTREDIQR